MKLFVFACVLVVGVCGVSHEKIAKIFSDFDYNGNDNINVSEVAAFFKNLQAKPDDQSITKATFVAKWGPRYGDSAAVSAIIYDHMDMNNDDLLTDADIPLFFEEVDKNHNGIEWDEFEPVFTKWYASAQT